MDKRSLRIQSIPSAINGVKSITPDIELNQAISIMVLNDYSQLPVIENERWVKGFISWKSIGTKKLLGDEVPLLVKDYMDENVSIHSEDTRLLAAVQDIIAKDFVLVKNWENKISGIVTITDLGEQFVSLAEPFIELEEIENSIRNIIDKSFSSAELREQIDSDQQIDTSADLTFGDYLFLLDNPLNWERLNLRIDRKVFSERLHEIRIIRNKLMHFRPLDDINEEMKQLRIISKFFRTFEKIGTK